MAAFLFPVPYHAFRYLHIQHHKYTNEPERDPDHWVALGSPLLLPLRWFTIEYNYYSIYLPKLIAFSRDPFEGWATIIQLLGIAAVVICSRYVGLGHTLLVTWILPGRVALGALAYFFDYLPHRPHNAQRKEDPIAATSITSLYGDITWCLTWPLLHQNYHAIHHMAPHIPFYQYSTTWYALKQELISRGIKIQPIIGFGGHTNVKKSL